VRSILSANNALPDPSSPRAFSFFPSAPCAADNLSAKGTARFESRIATCMTAYKALIFGPRGLHDIVPDFGLESAIL
jgi:hypothetical protein